MNLHLNTVLLLALLLSSACSGQQPERPRQAVQHADSDVAPQISEYVVNVFEDSRGRLWFSTMDDGVACYDPSASLMTGEKALTYFSVEQGLVGSTVTGIAEDKDGILWFGSHSGLSRFDGKRFTNYTTKEGLCNERVSQVFIDKAGTIWWEHGRVFVGSMAPPSPVFRFPFPM